MKDIKKSVTLIVFLFCALSVSIPLYCQGVIIDHKCTDISKIPTTWINQAKSNLRCSYGHTSHGSQLITGLEVYMDDSAYGSAYAFNTDGSIQSGVLSIADYTPGGDLGNPNFTQWESLTRTYLNGTGKNRNVVMWSWCGQVSGASSSDIDTYLNLMSGLERDYPNVKFVYITGHLDGSGTGGTLNVNNNRIRSYCKTNNKILFDFADIESYNPDGVSFLSQGADDGCNYSGGNWASQWISANPGSELARLAAKCGSCAHSETLNCVLKGGAAWWLMARIAGWDGTTVTPTDSITVSSPNGGENWIVGSSHNITWTSTGSITNVQIQYSSNNGTNWTDIIASTANDGSYQWTVPNTPSTQSLVRVRDVDGTPSDTSNAVFTISSVAVDSIAVSCPNGGENWTVGTSHNITWTSTGSIANVQIQYSSNNGTNWTDIVASTANDGSYQWTVPNTTSTQCLVRIRDIDETPSDRSNAVFTISNPEDPTISVYSPNGGEKWTAGSTHSIQWNATGTIPNVQIHYSIDNGANWILIVDSTPSISEGYDELSSPKCANSYSWVVPNTPSEKCLIRIRDIDGTPSDTSNSVFKILNVTDPSISVYTPNGGEKWDVGETHKIEWSATGDIKNVRIDYSIDKGTSWLLITESTPCIIESSVQLSSPKCENNYSWVIPNTVSDNCLVKISTTDGSVSDKSDYTFSIVSGKPPVMKLNRHKLNFVYVQDEAKPGAQCIRVSNSGGGTLNWTATANATWIVLSPTSAKKAGIITVNIEPKGLAKGDYSGTITVMTTGTSSQSEKVEVNLKVKSQGDDLPPIGYFDSPEDGATVSGSIALTGWALDDVRINDVKLYYEGKKNNKVYIGKAVFVEGARPDIVDAYPDYPCNYSGGWGYMLLTNFLPNQGNGTFTIHAIATDNAGHSATLGTKTIFCDNNSAVKPFGAIDTPDQGGTVSGKEYVVFGWVLTPFPNFIPTNGSTISIWVDGVNVGHPVYNQFREDIASLFPGYTNSSAAIGYYYLDTSKYQDGLHTISWLAQDNAGNMEGIGSRYFNIENSTSGSTGQEDIETGTASISSETALSSLAVEYNEPVRVRKASQPDLTEENLSPSEDGNILIESRVLELLEIRLIDENSSGRVSMISDLPVGSTFDIAKGVLYWQPGPGFLGDHTLQFLVIDSNGNTKRRNVIVHISTR